MSLHDGNPDQNYAVHLSVEGLSCILGTCTQWRLRLDVCILHESRCGQHRTYLESSSSSFGASEVCVATVRSSCLLMITPGIGADVAGRPPGTW